MCSLLGKPAIQRIVNPGAIALKKQVARRMYNFLAFHPAPTKTVDGSTLPPVSLQI
jgi:hypothetical protein